MPLPFHCFLCRKFGRLPQASECIRNHDPTPGPENVENGEGVLYLFIDWQGEILLCL